MNPVVFAAVAISLLAVGAVSMSSLAAQQATSSASVQKVALERERLAEQANAYISSVEPVGSNTKATVKNAGSSPVTIDHCLSFSPSSGIRPTAVKVMVDQIINPGFVLDVVLSGDMEADEIRCVTSKGTTLPVRLQDADSEETLNSAEYIDSFAVTADVEMASTEYFTNSAYTPWEKPLQPAQPAGSLTYHVPVSKPMNVNYVAREAPDGTVIEVVPEGSSVQYSAGQTIAVPITGPTSKVTIRFTSQDGAEQMTATVRPSFAEVSALSGNTRETSGSVSMGIDDRRCYEPSRGKYYDDYVATYSGNNGLIGADDWIDLRSPYCYSGSGKFIAYRSDLRAEIDSGPEIVQTFSFPAPKSTVRVTLYYDVSVADHETNCSNRNCDFHMGAYLDLGPGGIVEIPTDFTESNAGYNDTVEGTKTYNTTFLLTDLTPGQQVDIPVKLKSHISSEIFPSGSLIAGGINYFGDISTQLFID